MSERDSKDWAVSRARGRAPSLGPRVGRPRRLRVQHGVGPEGPPALARLRHRLPLDQRRVRRDAVDARRRGRVPGPALDPGARRGLRAGGRGRGRASRQARGQAGRLLRSRGDGRAERGRRHGRRLLPARRAPDAVRLQPEQQGRRRLPRRGHRAHAVRPRRHPGDEPGGDARRLLPLRAPDDDGGDGGLDRAGHLLPLERPAPVRPRAEHPGRPDQGVRGHRRGDRGHRRRPVPWSPRTGGRARGRAHRLHGRARRPGARRPRHGQRAAAEAGGRALPGQPRVLAGVASTRTAARASSIPRPGHASPRRCSTVATERPPSAGSWGRTSSASPAECGSEARPEERRPARRRGPPAGRGEISPRT